MAAFAPLSCPRGRSLFRYVFDVVEQRSTMALFTARADGGSATPAPQDFCKACLWQDNKAHHRRPHDGVLAAWADAMRAPY